MQLPDVNVLIYAHREDAPEHDRYAAWLRAITESDEPFALSEVVLASIIRIVTNPEIFDPPSPTDVAIAFANGSSIGRVPSWSFPAGAIGYLHGAVREHPRPTCGGCVFRRARDRTRM